MTRIILLLILFLLFPVEDSFASKFIPSLPDYHNWPVKMSYDVENSDEDATDKAYKYLERKELFFSSSVTEIYRKGEKKPRAIYWFQVKRNSRDEPVSAVLREYEFIGGRYELVNEDYIQIQPE